MKSNFTTVAKTALILVYLVIVAGALVRMTGSGMGCPDWPKCFGYYIPPTDIQELTWQENRSFEKGQVIIKDEKLLVAAGDFTTSKSFNPENWRNYTKHDYAIFNPTHTWIEYLNRLVGALAGLAVLAMAILSVWKWKKNKKLTLLSWFTTFLMGFQAWLGATVVYSVLNPVKITLHMIVALVIVGILLYIIYQSKEEKIVSKPSTTFKLIVVLTLLLSVVQVVLGTQVRQFVDHQVDIFGYNEMQKVLENPNITFYVHRSFSILIFLSNFYLVYLNKKKFLGLDKINWIIGLIGAEIATGIAMYYFDFPFGSQPAHLIIASLLFGFQFYLWLQVNSNKQLN
jgi:cytochrome c oxidase assembly protein subunit 15